MTASREMYMGCYPAARAAALSGVANSTVYDWARKGVVTPSVSQTREKLWSYADLMALRVVSWLRRPKADGLVRGTRMKEVRRALSELKLIGEELWDDSKDPSSALFVERSGAIVLRADDSYRSIDGQGRLADALDLLAPFGDGSLGGPDLRRPRPLLRIVPGKCSGEPHLLGTRLTTTTIRALVERGYDRDGIAGLYPSEDPEAIREAADLERQLALASAA